MPAATRPLVLGLVLGHAGASIGCRSPHGPAAPGRDDSAPSAPDTDTGPAVNPTCGAEPGLAVVQVAAHPGRLAGDVALTVELSAPATAAALCTADDDPSERHLAVSEVAGTRHELRLQGLLPSTAHTCRVAPLCPTMSAPPVSIAVPTGDGPRFPRLEVEVDPALGMTGYWTLLSYLDGACSENPRWLVLYDGEGVARWWHELPPIHWVDVEALFHPEDQAVVWGGGDDPEGRARVVGLWDGERSAVPLPPEGHEFSHDAKRLPDGRILTLDYRPNAWDGATFVGFGVQIHDLDAGRVDFDLSSQRYVDEGAIPGARWGDVYHANWLDWVQGPDGDDRLYVGLCYLWSILAIDPATGDIRYQVDAGQGWTVLDEHGSAIPEDAFPHCSHGNEVIGDDVLLVYDNGRERGYSQIAEWAFDPDTQTAQRRWHWTEPGWFQPTLGDVDDLGNGRILVTEAHPECWADTPGDRSEIVEVDRATGAVASRLRFPGASHTVYRAERYDGCALMSSTRACPELAALADELAPIVGW